MIIDLVIRFDLYKLSCHTTYMEGTYLLSRSNLSAAFFIVSDYSYSFCPLTIFFSLFSFPSTIKKVWIPLELTQMEMLLILRQSCYILHGIQLITHLPVLHQTAFICIMRKDSFGEVALLLGEVFSSRLVCLLPLPLLWKLHHLPESLLSIRLTIQDQDNILLSNF